MLMPGGVELPLCARNTGIYTGILTGVVLLVAAGRSRRVRQAHPVAFGVLLALIAAMAMDGTNAVLVDFGLPHLYQPTNALRLLTGIAAGMALAGLVTPVVARTLWRQQERQRALSSFTELARYLLAGVLLAAMILTQWPPLLYPIALASTAGLLLLLSTLNVLVIVTVARAEGAFTQARELLVPYSAGLCLGLVELVGLALLKHQVLGGIT
jgi:uncharacterized membrane protein